MYFGRYTEVFVRKLNMRPYSQLRSKIKSKCEMILQQPYSACKSEPLKANLSGKRSGRLDERYRIIYTVCEECYKQGHQSSNLAACPDCDDVPEQTVTFLDITDHYR